MSDWLEVAKERIKAFEGDVRDSRGRHVPYTCPAGYPTVGYGHNVENGISDAVAAEILGVTDGSVPGRHDDAVAAAYADGISEEVAMMLLEEDVASAMEDLDRHLEWWWSSPENVRIVMLDMMFNMGWGGGHRGLSSLKRFISAASSGDYDRAADLMLMTKYAKDVGGRADKNAELLRQAEENGAQ